MHPLLPSLLPLRATLLHHLDIRLRTADSLLGCSRLQCSLPCLMCYWLIRTNSRRGSIQSFQCAYGSVDAVAFCTEGIKDAGCIHDGVATAPGNIFGSCLRCRTPAKMSLLHHHVCSRAFQSSNRMAMPTTWPTISTSFPRRKVRVGAGDIGWGCSVRLVPFNSHQQQVKSSLVSTK